MKKKPFVTKEQLEESFEKKISDTVSSFTMRKESVKMQRQSKRHFPESGIP